MFECYWRLFAKPDSRVPSTVSMTDVHSESTLGQEHHRVDLESVVVIHELVGHQFDRSPMHSFATLQSLPRYHSNPQSRRCNEKSYLV